MANRITTEDYLISDNKDILKDIFVNTVVCNGNNRDTKFSYNDFGVNICFFTGNDYLKPYSIPEKWRDLWGSARHLDTLYPNFKIHIPNAKSSYFYNNNIDQWHFADNYQQNIIYLKSIIKPTNPGNNLAKDIPLAVIYDNTIFIFWNLSYVRDSVSKALFRYIINTAIKKIDWKQYKKEQPENYPEIQFKKMISEFYSQRESQIKGYLANAQADKTRFFKDFIRYAQQSEQYQKELDIIKNQGVNLQAESEKAIQYFAKCKKIKKFFVENGKLVFIFKDLHITFKKETLALPEYRAELDTGAGDFNLYLTKKSDWAYIHPHIFDGGNACLGNYQTIFAKLAQQGAFCQIIDLLLTFLETYNPDSPTIQWWQFRHQVLTGKPYNTDHREEAINLWSEYLKSTSQPAEQIRSNN